MTYTSLLKSVDITDFKNMEFKKKKVVDVHSEKKAGYWFLDKYNKCIKNKYNLHKIQWFFITEKVDNDRIKLVVSWQVDSPFEWEIVNPVIHVFCRGRNGLLLELEKPWITNDETAEASVVQEIESKDKLLIVSIAYKSFNERPNVEQQRMIKSRQRFLMFCKMSAATAFVVYLFSVRKALRRLSIPVVSFSSSTLSSVKCFVKKSFNSLFSNSNKLSTYARELL